MYDLTNIYVREKYREKYKLLEAIDTFSYDELTRNYKIRYKKCDIFANSDKSLPEAERRRSTIFQLCKHLDIYRTLRRGDERRCFAYSRIMTLIDCGLDLLSKENQALLRAIKRKLPQLKIVAEEEECWRNVYSKHKFLYSKIRYAINIRNREIKATAFTRCRSIRDRIKFWETLA
jgi:hypothetical protein